MINFIKRNRLLKMIVICLPPFVIFVHLMLLASVTVSGATTTDYDQIAEEALFYSETKQPEANHYIHNTLNMNLKFFHNDAAFNKRHQIPAEQKIITFMKVNKDDEQEWFQYLFHEPVMTNHTIALQSSELHLFNEQKEPVQYVANELPNQNEGQSPLVYLFGSLIAASVIALFALLLTKGSLPQNSDNMM